VKRIISMPLETGGTVELEIEGDAVSPVMRGAITQPLIEKSVASFETAVARVKPVATAVVQQLASGMAGTTSVKVKFGLKFTAEAGAIIASAGSEANFEVELTWGRGDSS
jgi:hypothetical protein